MPDSLSRQTFGLETTALATLSVFRTYDPLAPTSVQMVPPVLSRDLAGSHPVDALRDRHRHPGALPKPTLNLYFSKRKRKNKRHMIQREKSIRSSWAANRWEHNSAQFATNLLRCAHQRDAPRVITATIHFFHHPRGLYTLSLSQKPGLESDSTIFDFLSEKGG